MNYLEHWYQELPAAIEHVAARMPSNASIGAGLLAAVALWPVRADVQAYEGAAIDAVRDVVDTSAERVLQLVTDWGSDLLVVADRLNTQISTDAELQAACNALEDRFDIATQLAACIVTRFTPRANITNFQDAIKAALLNVGGTVNIGTYAVHIHIPTLDPEAQLTAARALLEQLPLDHVPDPDVLPTSHWMRLKANPLFVGRATNLQALAATLKAGTTTVIAAATGMGGLGKTQLASEFVHRYGQYFAGGVFWLSFADAAGVEAEIAACGGAGRLDLPGFATLDFSTQVQRVTREWQQPIPRLIVFDNCEDEKLLRDYVPTSGGCRVLVTSRRRDWDISLGVVMHELEVLPRKQSMMLLHRFLPDLAEDHKELQTICDELGDLPLALHLAGSFLKACRFETTPADYLKELRSSTLLDHESMEGVDLNELPTPHEISVKATFHQSYQRLNSDSAIDVLALALLTRSAHFAPGEPIPRNLLLATVDLPDITVKRRASRSLRRLVDFGLLDEEQDGALRLHRLVARFVLDMIKDQEAQTAVEEVLFKTAKQLRQAGKLVLLFGLLPHLRCSTDAAKQRRDAQSADLCMVSGAVLQGLSRFKEARHYYDDALTIRCSVFGENHSHVAAVLNSIGLLEQVQTHLIEAQPFFEQALSIWRQVGTEEVIATIHNNLGYLLLLQGRFNEAETYLSKALEIRKRLLTIKHVERREARQSEDKDYSNKLLATALSIHNMGFLLFNQGDFRKARKYSKVALRIRKQEPTCSPTSLSQTYNNLGEVLLAEAKYDKAEYYHSQALAVRNKLYTSSHNDIAESKRNLGAVFLQKKDITTAYVCITEALVIQEEVLGVQHRETAMTLHCLGNVLQAQERYTEAQSEYSKALAIFETLLGKDHLYVAMTLNKLAGILRILGDSRTAGEYLTRAINILEARVPEHPEFALSLHTLALLSSEAGQFEEATGLMRRALTIREVKLGAQHPDTQFSQRCLLELEGRDYQKT